MDSSALVKFLTRVELRWLFYFAALVLTVLAFFQEPLRFSNYKGMSGLPYSWEIYIFAICNLVNYFLTLFGLWLTIPFIFGLPNYWFVALFVFLMALFTEVFINTKKYIDSSEDDSFKPPPDYIYPKKYRLIIHYFIFIFDIFIFLQLFLATNQISNNAKTFLDKYLLGSFGGFVEGNRINFLTSWLALIGILYDIYNIRNQSNFIPCKVGLPNTWDY